MTRSPTQSRSGLSIRTPLKTDVKTRKRGCLQLGIFTPGGAERKVETKLLRTVDRNSCSERRRDTDQKLLSRVDLSKQGRWILKSSRVAVPGCTKSMRSQQEVRCHELCTGTKIGVVKNWLEWSLWCYQWCDKPGVNDPLVDVVEDSY